MRPTIACGAAAAVAAGGCGISATHYRLEPTRDCLKAHGFHTFVEDNWILKPSEGSLGTAFGRQYVELEFGKDAREARGIRAALRSAAGKPWPVDARANVAYVWSGRARDRVRGVLACLRT